MRVDETGKDRRAAAVHALRAAAGERLDLGPRPDRHHPPAGDGERRGPRTTRVERRHPRVLEQPVGGGQSDDGSGLASFSFIS